MGGAGPGALLRVGPAVDVLAVLMLVWGGGIGRDHAVRGTEDREETGEGERDEEEEEDEDADEEEDMGGYETDKGRCRWPRTGGCERRHALPSVWQTLGGL